MNRIYQIFFFLTVISLVLFLYISYEDYRFKNSPLSEEILSKLNHKNYLIKKAIKERYNLDFQIPIIVTKELPNNLFGLASYQNGKIKIQLNKKRFQENANYMIEYVLPHEYAHALMFYFGNFDKTNGGHTLQWQQICLDIGGQKCDRFVDFDDILIEKLGGVY